MKMNQSATQMQPGGMIAGSPDLDGDGRVSLGELLSSTLVIGAILFGILTILYAVVVGLASVNLRPALGWWARWYVWPSLLLAGLGTSAIGIWRMVRYERGERDRARVRAREWRREDAMDDWRQGLTDSEQNTRITQGDLDAAAFLILKQYYKDGTLARGKIKGVSDVKWNMVNDLLKQRHIRAGRANRLEPETFEAAWALWVQGKLDSRSWAVGEGAELVDRPPPALPRPKGR